MGQLSEDFSPAGKVFSGEMLPLSGGKRIIAQKPISQDIDALKEQIWMT
jgi:hypothetical protein